VYINKKRRNEKTVDKDTNKKSTSSLLTDKIDRWMAPDMGVPAMLRLQLSVGIS